MPEIGDYPSGNVTFVFTDIEESSKMTRRLEEHGLDLYQRKLQDPHRVRLLEEASRRHGVEIQRAGDGHMFVFQFAADALACVVAFQRSLRDDPIVHHEGEERFEIRVRVGVHTAERQHPPRVMENGLVEYPGNDTNFAARVAGLGRGGQILISERTEPEARHLEGCRLHRWPNRLLKSFEDRARVLHEILYHPEQTPLEPGMQWVPGWFLAEKKLYIERTALEAKVVDQFKRKAGGREGPRIVTLKAEGGMGKTRLAIQCAAHVADLFPDGVYFVPLATVLPSMEAVAEAVGRELPLPGQDFRPGTVLEFLRGRTILLVLDNYESVEDGEMMVPRLLNRLVAESHGLRLLVTGRSAVKLSDIERVIDDLDDGMTPDEARDLFLDRARLKWRTDRVLTASEETQLGRILELTAKIPLAIELAAAWVGYYGLKEIADGLEKTPLGDETALPPRNLRHDDETAHGRHNSLTRSLDWSYGLLGKTGGQTAQSLFATCGLFADSFDRPTAEIVAGVGTARDDLNRLLDASLIRRVEDDGSTRYRLHRFTREYALRRLDDSSGAEEARERFVDHYVHLVQENAREPIDIGRYAVLDQEWGNALAAFAVAETWEDPSSVVSMTTLGWFFRFRGRWSEAEFLDLRILALVRSADDRRNEGVILNNLAITYQVQGRYEEALAAYAVTLDISREFKDRVREGQTLNNMGVVYQAQGRYEEAQGRYEEALAAYAGSLEIRREFKDRVGEGQTLNNMGIVYRAQGRYEEALAAYAGSLEISREFKDRVGEGQTLNNMGVVYRAQGRYEEALAAYAGSLEISREFKDRVGEGQTLNNMGGLHQIQGRYEEALAAYAGSLEISREFKDRVGEGQTLNNMGGLHQIQGRYEEALAAYAGSLEISREFKDRVGEGQTLNNMGIVYEVQGRYEEALAAYAGSLEIKREFKDRVGEGRTLNNMGVVYQVQGRYEEALAAYAGSLEIKREFKDRVGEGRTLENFALLSEAREQWPEAIRWARQAVAVLETTEATVELENARRMLHRLEQAGADGEDAGEG